MGIFQGGTLPFISAKTIVPPAADDNTNFCAETAGIY
jgi:hypothetical protein